MSVWVKVSSGTAAFFMGSYSATDGQVFSSQFTATTTWQRFTWTRTVTTANYWYPLFTNTASGGNFLIWGAQLEAGAFATSYIPTTSATVTRAADVATMTGTNFSSWYRQDEGTIVISYQLLAASGTQPIAEFNNGTTSNYITTLGVFSGSSTFAVALSGVTQASLTPSVATTSPSMLAASWASNSFSAAVNGGVPQIDTAGSVPSVNQFLIGRNAFTSTACATISRIRYYRRRLPNANLQTLTT